jgi:hypothetical protein
MKPIYLNLIIFLLTFLTSTYIRASETDSLKKNSYFELSFGQSLIFISNSKQIDIRNQQAIVIPTSAILFFAEFRPKKTVRIPLFLNIPTESKQFLVNGVLINERASPTIGTGFTIRCFGFDIDKVSKIELEVGPLVSFIFDTKKNVRVAPIIGTRIKISRGANFIMYLGMSYSFGINALGMLYGTGTSF